MKNLLKKLYKWLLPLCYGLWVAVWLCCALVHFVGDGLRAEQGLIPQEAAPADIQQMADGTWASASIDPQLVWEGLNAEVRTLRLRADFTLAEGEMDLFYTRKEGQGFSLNNRVIAVPQQDGSYLYTLPAGNVHSLRLDMGNANENTITIHEITLNPQLPAGQYFVPTLRDIVAALAVPGLACCAIYIILEIVKRILAKR